MDTYSTYNVNNKDILHELQCLKKKKKKKKKNILASQIFLENHQQYRSQRRETEAEVKMTHVYRSMRDKQFQ